MSLQNFLLLLVLGALAGWLAGLILRGRGFGLVGNLIIGVGGAFLGRFIFGLLGFRAANSLASFLSALAGALALLWLLSLLPRGRGRKK